MESSAQGAGAPREQATREMPPVAPPPTPGAARGDADLFAERPELFVGAAFAGGLVLAQLLKRVRR